MNTNAARRLPQDKTKHQSTDRIHFSLNPMDLHAGTLVLGKERTGSCRLRAKWIPAQMLYFEDSMTFHLRFALWLEESIACKARRRNLGVIPAELAGCSRSPWIFLPIVPNVEMSHSDAEVRLSCPLLTALNRWGAESERLERGFVSASPRSYACSRDGHRRRRALQVPEDGCNPAIVPENSPMTKSSWIDKPFVAPENQPYFAIATIQS
jgi:hypothetical protein